MQPDLGADADPGHRRSLGEHLGVGSDADLEVLRPHAPLDQRRLQRHRLVGARHDAGQVETDALADLAADRVGGGRVPLGLLLDHPLQHAGGEGDPARLDGLQIDRAQEPGPRGIAPVVGRIGQDLRQRADRLARRVAGDRHRVGPVQQLRHRRNRRREVHHRVAANRDGRGTFGVGSPDPADEGRLPPVFRQAGFHREGERGHDRQSATSF